MKPVEYLEKYLEPSKLQKGIKRLQNGEPAQYIIGNVNFYGNEIKVNSHVLIPRFVTEELIYKTKQYIEQYFPNKNLHIVDLGTGSGCIAITIKKLFPKSKVHAVDISKEALEIATENAILNKTEIEFYLGNMLEPLSEQYDVIISNPPYLTKEDTEIMDIVKNNEPPIALYADQNGLAFYQQILKNIKPYIKSKTLIAFEMDYRQGKSIINLAKNYFPNQKTWIEKDLEGKDRYFFMYIEKG